MGTPLTRVSGVVPEGLPNHELFEARTVPVPTEVCPQSALDPNWILTGSTW